MKTLVVYYSRKGYVRDIAIEKAESEDADILCIDTIDDTVGYDGFMRCVKKAVTGRSMELFPYDTDISSYEKIIICTPVWCSKVCLPIKTFITREKHNISLCEFVIVSASGKGAQTVASEMDKILRLENSPYESLQCVFGKVKREEAEACE